MKVLLPLFATLFIPTFSYSQTPAVSEITHGPMLGRPGSDTMGIWARTSVTSSFQVRYGEDSANLTRISHHTPTRLEKDNTAWAELTGLKPNTRYYYEVVAYGQASGPGGSFKTWQDSANTRNDEHNPKGLFNFRFEFGSCSSQSSGNGYGPILPLYETMNREVKHKVDFAIMNGDWLYEDPVRGLPASEWRKQVGISESDTPFIVETSPPIVGVWENYKLYLDQAPNLREWHANVPSYYTFDDHELLNDIWGAGTPGFRDRKATFRDIGVQAWFDYLGWSNPESTQQEITFGSAKMEAGSNILYDPKTNFSEIDLKETGNLMIQWGTPTAGVRQDDHDNTGGDPNAGVYEILGQEGDHRLKLNPPADATRESTYSIARTSYSKFTKANCDFFMLDTKTFREVHDLRHPDKPGISLLGPQQKKWLIDSMKNSDSDFFFLCSSVPFMIPHVGGGGAFVHNNKDESWTVFIEEREQLIEFFDTLGKPVFVLTGDLHNSFAVKITDTVWEFCSGPHNSVNHSAKDAGGRPPNGKFKWGPREVDIRWSSYMLDDIPRDQRKYPRYCVVQVNNVFNNPLKLGEERWVAYPHPQVVFQYYDGMTGDLLYAESISTTRD